MERGINREWIVGDVFFKEYKVMGNSSAYQTLIDSDAFVGRFYRNDQHHDKARQIFEELESKSILIVTTSMVIAETATVLSHRQGQSLATKFLEVIERSKLPVIHIDEKLLNEAFEIFKRQAKKGTSATDCANVAVMKRFRIPEIFSFDGVYSKKFGLSVVE